MIVKNYKTEDIYDTVVSWWVGHSFPPLSIDFLPTECFIISNEGKQLYAMFFYHTNSNLCWFAFPVSNPDLTKEEKGNGLLKLIEGMTEYAVQNGYKFIFTTSPVKPVQDCLLENGFQLGDVNVNHYVKII